MSDPPVVLWYALLLSLPVGLGVVLAFGQTTGRLSALAVGAGVAVAAGIFALVVVGAHSGRTD